ncbi:hypothetical protein BU17DRAFT_67364 [Hysterangium stoloniferum]|nr:hypothetical protein BU17DRAFT_67364 [Hysterangium stoloniferum]
MEVCSRIHLFPHFALTLNLEIDSLKDIHCLQVQVTIGLFLHFSLALNLGIDSLKDIHCLQLAPFCHFFALSPILSPFEKSPNSSAFHIPSAPAVYSPSLAEPSIMDPPQTPERHRQQEQAVFSNDLSNYPLISYMISHHLLNHSYILQQFQAYLMMIHFWFLGILQ